MGLVTEEFSDRISVEVRSESIRIYTGKSEEKHLFGCFYDQYAARARSQVVEHVIAEAQMMFMDGDKDKEAAMFRDLASRLNTRTWDSFETSGPSIEISKEALADLVKYLTGEGSEHLESWQSS